MRQFVVCYPEKIYGWERVLRVSYLDQKSLLRDFKERIRLAADLKLDFQKTEHICMFDDYTYEEYRQTIDSWRDNHAIEAGMSHSEFYFLNHLLDVDDFCQFEPDNTGYLVKLPQVYKLSDWFDRFNSFRNTGASFMELSKFDKTGFIVVPRLFSESECDAFTEHFMELRKAGPYPDDITGDASNAFPRLLNMHRSDSVAMGYVFDLRITSIVRDLLGEDFLALQSMFYFKPGSSLGQAWHQDQYYFKAPCIAAWLAVSDANISNGCLHMVDDRLPLLPVHKADPTKSFTNIEIDVTGYFSHPLEVKKGDVIFFDGLVPHSSQPNDSDSFRSSLISHYARAEVRQIAKGYNPVYSSDRQEMFLEEI